MLLRSLREDIDSTATGRMPAGIFAALADYERELMHKRAAAARVRGKHTGCPPKLTLAHACQVRAARRRRIDQ